MISTTLLFLIRGKPSDYYERIEFYPHVLGYGFSKNDLRETEVKFFAYVNPGYPSPTWLERHKDVLISFCVIDADFSNHSFFFKIMDYCDQEGYYFHTLNFYKNRAQNLKHLIVTTYDNEVDLPEDTHINIKFSNPTTGHWISLFVIDEDKLKSSNWVDKYKSNILFRDVIAPKDKIDSYITLEVK